jgi:hypothetical protein
MTRKSRFEYTAGKLVGRARATLNRASRPRTGTRTTGRSPFPGRGPIPGRTGMPGGRPVGRRRPAGGVGGPAGGSDPLLQITRRIKRALRSR